MLVQFDGNDYQFDLDEVDLPEARYIKRETGLSLLKFQEGVIESDPDCLALAYWLMMKQNGTIIDPRKVNFKIGKFSLALGEAYQREIARREAEELNPPKGEAGEAAEPATT